MSQQMGVSRSELNSALSQLRYELEDQIREVSNELVREITRLENEMREVGDMVVRAIGQQTSELTGAIDEHKRVLVAGVAATTLMIERTKRQMEADFATTIARIEQQTESALQVEMGKKIADARAINGKLQAFIGDIRSRFDRALLGVNVNRELYSLNFRKIVDDFESKVRTIGNHILQIRDEDIAPAVKAAGFTQEVTHGLPMEVDLRRLEAIAVAHGLFVIADEVYEHMVFDGAPHRSACRYPALAERAFVISSFGKTYHVTGWKVAYCVAPAALTAEFRKVHQFNVFTVNTPAQHGLAAYMADPAPYLGLAAFYQRKRDLFREGLAGTRLRLLPCEGTYFQLVDYTAVSDLPENDFATWLTSEIGVAAIPLSAFCGEPVERGVVRFCFAKKDETLRLALDRLARL